MRCDVCGSSDSVFFIKPDGSDGELHMCQACAAARGYAASDESLGSRTASAPCPSCGWTAERLKSTGRLGCPLCATVFRREILAILRRSGRATDYETGMASVRSRELAEAIRNEDFERAAAIRDRPGSGSGRRKP